MPLLFAAWKILWAAAWQNKQNDMCTQRGLKTVWTSAQSDQSSLCTQWVSKDPWFLHWDSEDSDQTKQMPRLIGVFAGRLSHFVGFVMLWLISVWNSNSLARFCGWAGQLQSYLITHLWRQIWATSWENLFYAYVNNKGADQPVHLRSLISTFVVHCLDSIIPLVSISEISRL